jgi:hypothetical protein
MSAAPATAIESNGYRLNDTGFVGGAPLSAISLRAPNRSSGSEHVARAGMNYRFNSWAGRASN